MRVTTCHRTNYLPPHVLHTSDYTTTYPITHYATSRNPTLIKYPRFSAHLGRVREENQIWIRASGNVAIN